MRTCEIYQYSLNTHKLQFSANIDKDFIGIHLSIFISASNLSKELLSTANTFRIKLSKRHIQISFLHGLTFDTPGLLHCQNYTLNKIHQ